MASYRIGIGSFNLKDGAVGIGTESTGLGNLKVEGTIKTTDLDVGVSTFTRYSGFEAEKTNIIRDQTLSGEYSTTGDIVVDTDKTLTVGVGSTACIGSVECISVKHHFSVPVGDTVGRNKSSGYAEGTVRYNRDLGTMEFFNGNEWRQFTYISDAQRSPSNRGRGVFGGGSTPNRIKNIDYVIIASTGNAVQFGELTVGRSDCGSCSSQIRGIWTGGFDDATSGYNDEIDYITLASEGNAIDFGNLSLKRQPPTSFSSSTRGITMGGYAVTPHVPSNHYTNVMDYVELATLGNALDFGDTITGRGGAGSFSSSTRGVIGGGISPVMQTNAEFVTIASKGNAVRFGELTAGVRFGGASNSTRGIFTSAGASPGYHGVGYQYITIASEGNAEYFGDMISTLKGAGTSNQTRAVFGGGSSPARLNTLEYLTIATTGNASDFGDMTIARSDWDGACSDSHGGLGGY